MDDLSSLEEELILFLKKSHERGMKDQGKKLCKFIYPRSGEEVVPKHEALNQLEAKGYLANFCPNKPLYDEDELGEIYLSPQGAMKAIDIRHKRKEKRNEKWSQRRFTIFMSLLTFILGLVASWIIANRLVDLALSPLLGS